MEKPEKYQRQRAKKRIYVDSNTGQHLPWHEILNLIPSWQDRSNAPDVIQWPSATAVPWTCTWERSTRLELWSVMSAAVRSSISRGTRRFCTSEKYRMKRKANFTDLLFLCPGDSRFTRALTAVTSIAHRKIWKGIFSRCSKHFSYGFCFINAFGKLDGVALPL